MCQLKCNKSKYSVLTWTECDEQDYYNRTLALVIRNRTRLDLELNKQYITTSEQLISDSVLFLLLSVSVIVKCVFYELNTSLMSGLPLMSILRRSLELPAIIFRGSLGIFKWSCLM